jgi:flagellar assembly protein FliH
MKTEKATGCSDTEPRGLPTKRLRVLRWVEINGECPVPIPISQDQNWREEEDGEGPSREFREEERKLIWEQSRKDGWNEGFKAGYQEGHEVAVAEMRGLVGALGTIRKGLEESRSQMLRELEKEITTLALEIAEKLALQEITTSPEAVIKLVRKVVERSGSRKSLKVRLSPDDYRCLKEAQKDLFASMADMDELDLVEDESLRAGDCVVETSAGIVDARMERRLERLKNSVMEEG